MDRIHVVFPDGADREPYGLLIGVLEELPAARAPREVRLFSTGSLPLPPDRDVVVGEANFGDPASSLVAADPFVLVTDQRFGPAPMERTEATLLDLEEWLTSLGTSTRHPLVVAGDTPLDFAAFILYLAGELSDDETLDRVERALDEYAGSSSAEPPSQDEVESLIGDLETVVTLLEDWTARGILAFNWTNWDHIAVRQAFREGTAAVGFQQRSRISSWSRQERFHLRVQLPPVGPDRRTYRMTGVGVAVLAGDGPSAEGADGIRSVFLQSEVQHAIETETTFTPVRLGSDPVNREHRDMVRSIEGAADYVMVSEAVAAHPMFRRLHQLLR